MERTCRILVLSKRNLTIISQTTPQSPIAESYRTIRTNIQFASVSNDVKVMMTTSTAPGEGKTSTASNLAVVYAQAGQRVLLIDADLRKPDVHQRFGLSNLIGLSTLLIKDKSIAECIDVGNIPNLSILTSGPVPPNPSELLSSRAFAEFIQQMRDEYDFIIVDSPPVLNLADALVLSHVVDGVVFIINSASTNRTHVKNSLASLEQIGARIMGVVLNRVRRPKGDSYYYNYYTTQTGVSS